MPVVDAEKHVMAMIGRRAMNEAELLSDHMIHHAELPTIMNRLVEEGKIEVTSNNPLTWGIRH